MLVLNGETFTITQKDILIPENTSDGMPLGFSFGYIIEGDNCLEFIDMTEITPNHVQDITLTFRAVKNGSCVVKFYIYVIGFSITSGTPINSQFVKVGSLSSISYTFFNIFIIIFVIVLIFFLFYLNNGFYKWIK
jgi:hypothetical protein